MAQRFQLGVRQEPRPHCRVLPTLRCSRCFRRRRCCGHHWCYHSVERGALQGTIAATQFPVKHQYSRTPQLQRTVFSFGAGNEIKHRGQTIRINKALRPVVLLSSPALKCRDTAHAPTIVRRPRGPTSAHGSLQQVHPLVLRTGCFKGGVDEVQICCGWWDRPMCRARAPRFWL